MARDKPTKDPMGGHVRLYWEIIDSPAWLALGWAAQGIYIAMRRQLKGTNNGDISATLSHLRHYRVRSSSTLAGALRALEVVGLIAKTRQGHIACGAKVCNLYRFTDQAVYDIPKLGITRQPATNEWKAWANVRSAEAAIHQADAVARRPPAENTSKPRNPKRFSSESEAVDVFTGSRPEHGDVSSVRNSKQVKVVAITR